MQLSYFDWNTYMYSNIDLKNNIKFTMLLLWPSLPQAEWLTIFVWMHLPQYCATLAPNNSITNQAITTHTGWSYDT